MGNEARFQCIFDGCTRSFDRLREFRRHIEEDHGSNSQSEHDSDSDTKPTRSAHNNATTTNPISDTVSNTGSAAEAETSSIAMRTKKRKRETADSAERQSRSKEVKRRKKTVHHWDGDFSTPHCLCRRPDDGQGMIECSRCSEWYHYFCVGLTKRTAVKFSGDVEYQCPRCNNQQQRESEKIKAKETLEKKKEASTQRKKKESTMQAKTTKKEENSPKKASAKSTKQAVSAPQKISEMNSTQLAHLCLKLQERVNALEAALRNTKQNLQITKQLYQTKANEERGRRGHSRRASVEM